MQALLAKGARKDASDDSGRTPLHLACLSGKELVVRALLRARVEVNATDADRITPLLLALSPAGLAGGGRGRRQPGRQQRADAAALGLR